MVLTVLEGSFAVAKAVSLCKPDVIALYPITPQTHIAEGLASLIADGKMKSRHIETESEFSALSAVIGASAAGSRAYTATSSQGLALMHELLFASAGMRLPLVMNVVNRALSAPINIWNDQQDSVSERDAGWIQLYAETNQEASDLTIKAFKIAEDKKVLLPVMVCLDGFFLSHTIEPVDMPSNVDKFLPKYKPLYAYLDPKRPISQGTFAYPAYYNKFREDLSDAIDKSALVIKKVNNDFSKMFGRKSGNGLIEEYKNDRKISVITMGSLAGNLRFVVNNRKDCGLLKIISFRPLPKKEIAESISKKDTVIVFEKDISLGASNGALFDEIRSLMYSSTGKKPKIIGVVCGIGGVDVTVDKIEKIIDASKKMKDGEVVWLS